MCIRDRLFVVYLTFQGATIVELKEGQELILLTLGNWSYEQGVLPDGAIEKDGVLIIAHPLPSHTGLYIVEQETGVMMIYYICK